MYCYEFPKADNTSSIICYHRHSAVDKGEDRLTLVAIRRAKEPYKDKLALPGGFLEVMTRAKPEVAQSANPGETLERCAQRELQEETGILVSEEDLVLVCVQSKPDRDPRNHVIDHVYSVRVEQERIERAVAADDAAELKILQFDRESFKDSLGDSWAFDHADSLRRFFKDQLGWL